MRQRPRNPASDSQSVCGALERWLMDRPSLKIIAAFSALPDEVDLSEIIARHPERQWVFPRVDGESLKFHQVKNPETDLISGAFKIFEPLATDEEIPVDQIQVFLCPGLAFDAGGGRLGRGRGFYDRMLANAAVSALKLGICFPDQLVADTFSEPHDVRMDTVISC
ncbi:MAG: 5-formyltetrahydrofolate cyclo-ligase [Gloeobacteraceae cyanobacterium ES-bin-144]|nr:5-formyltetrahydrofolate cyclo-ligase [Verrucomicrobiales bacterium]